MFCGQRTLLWLLLPICFAWKVSLPSINGCYRPCNRQHRLERPIETSPCLVPLYANRDCLTAANSDQSSQLLSPDTPSAVSIIKRQYFPVFWLLRFADWLQGPYFFAVYNTKTLNGQPVTASLVSKLFLIGFGVSGILGTRAGRFADQKGRKLSILILSVVYSCAALSTLSNNWTILVLGRVLSGLGTSLLAAAPDAWLVGECERRKIDKRWLGHLIGQAFAGDAILAIIAGYIASIAANRFGPTGPFILSSFCLLLAGVLCTITWTENSANKHIPDSDSGMESLFRMAINDRKLLIVGGMHALFESAMYVFVMQWSPIAAGLLPSTAVYSTPYGLIFSCFMGCCWVGSTVFSRIAREGSSTLSLTRVAFALSSIALSVSALLTSPIGLALPHLVRLIGLSVMFLVFEVCVGIYFPAIGVLRSQSFPSSQRASLTTLFGLPMNALVIAVMALSDRMKINGALATAAVFLTIAAGLSQLAVSN